MSDPADKQVSLAHQLRIRLDALKAAGVEYLPRLKGLPVPVPQPPPSLRPSVATPVASGATASAPVRSEVSGEVNDARQSLTQLAQEVAKCSRCPELFSTRTQTVFGVGPLKPDLCFVGEAPGADEDRQGEPFVGLAGQLLTKIITAMGLKREEVYICNTLKCRPPNNATPNTTQLSNCRSYLDRQLELIQPKFLCCLGGVAAKHLLDTSTGITKLRGQIYRYRDIPMICTYHPSYLLRLEGDAQKRAKAECWEDMKRILRELGRPIPGSG